MLDEPTIGLHPHEVGRLTSALRRLRDRGNTLVVVEHDAAVIRASDHVVDLGPGAGEAGGRLLFSGPIAGFAHAEGSATADFLSGRRRAAHPGVPASGHRTSGHADRCPRQQPQVDRRDFPAGSPLRRDGRQRGGQEHARRGDAVPGPPIRIAGEAAIAGGYDDLTGNRAISPMPSSWINRRWHGPPGRTR